MEKAIFGAGCFWQVEIDFANVDPEKVSYDQLLDLFWESHDPTQVNRQGPDVGHQYRSAIFYTTPRQHESAVASMARVQTHTSRPIATEITAASEFYPAEDYHQRYLEKRGMATCRVPASIR